MKSPKTILIVVVATLILSSGIASAAWYSPILNLFNPSQQLGAEKPLAPNQLAPSPVAGYILTADTATSTAWITTASIGGLWQQVSDYITTLTDGLGLTVTGTTTLATTTISTLSSKCLKTDSNGVVTGITPVTTYAVPRLSNASTYQTTPTYDGSNQSVHPDIYYNASGWNGYKYWMLFEPLPLGSDDYEDPSILVSNDGDSWVIPAGGSNPIVPRAYPSGFHSDGDMVLNTDTDVMHVIYRYTNDATDLVDIMVASTTDGITWTSPATTTFTGLDGQNFASPTVVYESGVYYLWVADVANDVLIYSTSTDMLTWTSATRLQTIPNIWHLDVEKVGSNYIMVESDSGTYTNELYYFWSSNKTKWNYGGLLLKPSTSGWDEDKLYRSTFIVDGTTFKLWYTGIKDNVYHVGYAEDTDWEFQDDGCGIEKLGLESDALVDIGSYLAPKYSPKGLVLTDNLWIQKNPTTGGSSGLLISTTTMPSQVSNYIHNFSANTGLLIEPTGAGGGDPLVVKSAAGNTKLAVDGATGYVGIGTSTPITDLTIVGNGADFYLQQANGNYSVTFASRDDGSGLIRIFDNEPLLTNPKIQLDSIGITYFNTDYLYVFGGTDQLHIGYGFQVGTSTLLNSTLRVDGTASMATTTINGFLGVGTTTPSHLITLAGDSADMTIRQASGAYSGIFGSRDDGSGFLRLINNQADYNDYNLSFESNNNSYIATGYKFFFGVQSQIAAASTDDGFQISTSTYIHNDLTVRQNSGFATTTWFGTESLGEYTLPTTALAGTRLPFLSGGSGFFGLQDKLLLYGTGGDNYGLLAFGGDDSDNLSIIATDPIASSMNFIMWDVSQTPITDALYSFTGKLTVSATTTLTNLAGSGNAFACLNSSGELYRSATACNP